ncbi:hypothetical protein SAMN04488065_1566 [Haloplanus vescus]|uniref:Uncharacterized protein n=1 Tax=Haloplanus vescus TaxID=555874 RepID=A0A1H3XJ77_9EURY|nr:hypothetical protein [Haloplanus vescus]SDZ98672.1 hypothetical protein SAMN04488065_1566 [Haloplanus vescus]
MRASAQIVYHEEDCPSAIEPVINAIGRDDRLGPTGAPFSDFKQRACELITIMYERGAYSGSDIDERSRAGVTATEFDDTEQFSPTQQTLHQNLKTLEQYGYLDRDGSGASDQFAIADAWMTVDIDGEGLVDAAGSPLGPDIDGDVPVETIDDGESTGSLRNYQLAAKLAADNAANLTPNQRLVTSIFRTGGVVVGIGSGLLFVAGIRLSPHLVAAGESGLLAAATLLIGWLWFQFMGSVAGRSEERHERVGLSETT